MLLARLGGIETPPVVGKPSSERADTQLLYFIMGNLSLTSSIVMSFFSRRRLGRAMFSMMMGSPSVPARIALARALCRKQYLTPTMILL